MNITKTYILTVKNTLVKSLLVEEPRDSECMHLFEISTEVVFSAITVLREQKVF